MVEKIRGGFISLSDIKDIEFQSNEMDTQVTIGEWLKELLCRVWMEKSEFYSKRAFGGSSDWAWDIYVVLYEHYIIDGTMSEFEELELSREDYEKADKIILDIIIDGM